MRARYPDRDGFVESCGVPIFYQEYGAGDRTVLLIPPWQIVPLRRHFEQQIHVPHRLARYRAGARLDYDRTDPEALAQAIADGLKRPELSRDVETDGARRAAALITGLL